MEYKDIINVWNHKKIFWFEILKYILIFIITGYFLHALWKLQKFVSLVNKLPMYKVAFGSLIGHAHVPLYFRYLILIAKLPYTAHVYDFMNIIGDCFLHMKEGMATIWAFHYPIVFVFKANTVETILNHNTELVKPWLYGFFDPWLGNGLLTSDGAKWKTRRKLLTPAFHFNILKDFLHVFNSQAKVFVTVLKNHTKDEFINIVPYATRCSLDIICETLLGAEMHIQTDPSSPYLKAVHSLTSTVFERTFNPLLWPDLLFHISPTGKSFNKHTKQVHDFTYKLIREKKAKLLSNSKPTHIIENDDDTSRRKKRALLDLLLDEHINNNSLSEDDIREEIDTFTFEGHDTTSMAMSWALYLIGLHPGVQEKIREEMDSIFETDDRDVTVEDLKHMKYLECVIKESQRLYPSVSIFGRLLKEDLEFQGRIVPKGSMCFVVAHQLHRDPDVFPNPEKFDPDRFTPENSIGRHPFAYVPFSAGPRNCIGQRFAFMELKVVISTILRKLKIRSLDPRDQIQLINETILRPLEGLRLEIRPHDYIPRNKPVYHYYP